MDYISKTYEVDLASHRLRLDRFLAKVIPDLHARAIDRLLRSGRVRIGAEVRTARHCVKQGTVVTVDFPGIAVGDPLILHQSPHAIALAKPPGIPTAGTGTDTLLHWLCNRLHKPPGVIHRLDRETSGLVLFSLSPEGHRLLEGLFRRREVSKAYWAMISGRITPASGTVDLSLGPVRSGRVRVDPAGKTAVTDYRTIETGSGWSLLELAPRTGRTHQIRVHLAAQGKPVIGDSIYGHPTPTLNPPRLWLHALKLALPAPVAEQAGLPRELECPLWSDLAAHRALLAI